MSCVLFFNGCTDKTIYLGCKAEEPIRTQSKNCGGVPTKEFGECASIKYVNLEKDYDILLSRFRSCK